MDTHVHMDDSCAHRFHAALHKHHSDPSSVMLEDALIALSPLDEPLTAMEGGDNWQRAVLDGLSNMWIQWSELSEPSYQDLP